MSRRDVQDDMDAFLAMLGHELRQPLAPIRTALEIMRRRPSREAGQRALGTIERQIWQMTQLVDDLKDYADARAGRLRLRREVVAIRPILDAAIDRVRPLLVHREQRADVLCAAEPIHLNADPSRLTQLLALLLGSAARLTEPASAVAVEATADLRHVGIHIRDVGQGIPADKLRQTLNLMLRVEADDQWPRHGLALAVARMLVDLHGGTVALRPPAAERGAEFVVVLPREPGG